MEAQWHADRSTLRALMHTRPDLPLTEMARRVGRSSPWAKKWAQRLRAAPPHDLAVLRSRSRAHTAPYPTWDPLVLRRIEQLRLHPPEGLHRVPGPKALLSYLPRDVALQASGCPLPRSTSTRWKLLTRLGLLVEKTAVKHREEPLCDP